MNMTLNKVPQVTLLFWVMKICATTLGETAGDLVSMTLNVGYGLSTLLLLALFVISLIFQLQSKTFQPALYWAVILTTSTAGTTCSDYMDRTLGLGYANGAMLLAGLLLLILATWYLSEKTLSVSSIKSFRVEVFYWMAILVSNTLGTALGDYLADDSGLGFFGGAILIGGVISIIAVVYKITNINRILLFWMAFILTRPFGATFGDFLTKPSDAGGLGFGTFGTSSILTVTLILLVAYVSYKPLQGK
jgi:uncharacterized membrane-anchored protein